MDAPGELTVLLRSAADGRPGALEQVFTALYPDLRRIAHARLRGRPLRGDLGTTALVHESFMRLVQTRRLVVNDRKHFFTYAAKAMRHVIIDFARAHCADRRGGGVEPVELTPGLSGQVSGDGGETLVKVNDALSALEGVDAGLAELVEMRYFAGYTEVEIAELLGVSERTVRRQWEKARAFLLVSLKE